MTINIYYHTLPICLEKNKCKLRQYSFCIRHQFLRILSQIAYIGANERQRLKDSPPRKAHCDSIPSVSGTRFLRNLSQIDYIVGI